MQYLQGITAIGWSHYYCPMMQYSHDMTTWYEIFWQYSLEDGPVCSLKSLSNMMYAQTSDRYVEKDGELFLECYISGAPMAH